MSNFTSPIAPAKTLNEEQAVSIWLAKWRGESVDYLLARFGISEATIHKIWNNELFPDARQQALRAVWESDPDLAQQMRLSMPQLDTLPVN